MRSITLNYFASLDSFKNCKSEEINFIFDFESYGSDSISDIANYVRALKRQNPKAQFSINAEGRNFTDYEFGIFLSLYKELRKQGVELKFGDSYKHDYSILELMKADKILDAFINKINVDTLSPFEKYLLIYDYLAKKQYKMEDKSEKTSTVHISRDILSVMNSDYIVCEGYANLMSYLCENVGIRCFNQYLSTHNNKTSLHANNLVYIRDDKYNIHGLYYSDVTWDSAISKKTKNYCFCLIPLDDAYNMETSIDVMPIYHMFYDMKDAFFRVCDVDNEFSFVGHNTCKEPPFYFDYQKSKAEEIFELNDVMREYYQFAVDTYLKNRKNAIGLVKKLFEENNVPANIYDLCVNVPFGATLPFFIALLCYNPKSTNMVKYGIKELLEHKDDPKDKTGSDLSGEILPQYRCSNVYGLLDVLNDMEDEEINLSYERLSERNVNYKLSSLDPTITFEEWLSKQDMYPNLVAIIKRYMNISLYKRERYFIQKNFSKGEPIPLETFKTALKNVYTFEGISNADKMVDESIKETKENAKKSFNKYASNCFKKS